MLSPRSNWSSERILIKRLPQHFCLTMRYRTWAQQLVIMNTFTDVLLHSQPTCLSPGNLHFLSFYLILDCGILSTIICHIHILLSYYDRIQLYIKVCRNKNISIIISGDLILILKMPQTDKQRDFCHLSSQGIQINWIQDSVHNILKLSQLHIHLAHCGTWMILLPVLLNILNYS